MIYSANKLKKINMCPFLFVSDEEKSLYCAPPRRSDFLDVRPTTPKMDDHLSGVSTPAVGAFVNQIRANQQSQQHQLLALQLKAKQESLDASRQLESVRNKSAIYDKLRRTPTSVNEEAKLADKQQSLSPNADHFSRLLKLSLEENALRARTLAVSGIVDRSFVAGSDASRMDKSGVDHSYNDSAEYSIENRSRNDRLAEERKNASSYGQRIPSEAVNAKPLQQRMDFSGEDLVGSERDVTMDYDSSMTEEEMERSLREVLPSENQRKKIKRTTSLSVGNAVDSSADSGSTRRIGVEIKTYDQFSMNILRKYFTEKKTRVQHRHTVLKSKEQALIDKTRAELSWLEQQTKIVRHKGADDLYPLLQEKQRSVIKLHRRQQAGLQILQEFAQQALELRRHSPLEADNVEFLHLSAQQLSQKLKESDVNIEDLMDAFTDMLNGDDGYPVSEHNDNGAGSTGPSQSDVEESVSLADESVSLASDQTTVSSPSCEKIKRKLKMKLDQKYLTVREQGLRQRRMKAEELLAWKCRLDEEEREILRIEREAVLTAMDKPSIVEAHTEGGEESLNSTLPSDVERSLVLLQEKLERKKAEALRLSDHRKRDGSVSEAGTHWRAINSYDSFLKKWPSADTPVNSLESLPPVSYDSKLVDTTKQARGSLGANESLLDLDSTTAGNSRMTSTPKTANVEASKGLGQVGIYDEHDRSSVKSEDQGTDFMAAVDKTINLADNILETKSNAGRVSDDKRAPMYASNSDQFAGKSIHELSSSDGSVSAANLSTGTNEPPLMTRPSVQDTGIISVESSLPSASLNLPALSIKTGNEQASVHPSISQVVQPERVSKGSSSDRSGSSSVSRVYTEDFSKGSDGSATSSKTYCKSKSSRTSQGSGKDSHAGESKSLQRTADSKTTSPKTAEGVVERPKITESAEKEEEEIDEDIETDQDVSEMVSEISDVLADVTDVKRVGLDCRQARDYLEQQDLDVASDPSRVAIERKVSKSAGSSDLVAQSKIPIRTVNIVGPPKDTHSNVEVLLDRANERPSDVLGDSTQNKSAPSDDSSSSDDDTLNRQRLPSGGESEASVSEKISSRASLHASEGISKKGGKETGESELEMAIIKAAASVEQFLVEPPMPPASDREASCDDSLKPAALESSSIKKVDDLNGKPFEKTSISDGDVSEFMRSNDVEILKNLPRTSENQILGNFEELRDQNQTRDREVLHDKTSTKNCAETVQTTESRLALENHTKSPQRDIPDRSQQRDITDMSQQRDIADMSPQRIITDTSPQRIITDMSPQRDITDMSPHRDITDRNDVLYDADRPQKDSRTSDVGPVDCHQLTDDTTRSLLTEAVTTILSIKHDKEQRHNVAVGDVVSSNDKPSSAGLESLVLGGMARLDRLDSGPPPPLTPPSPTKSFRQSQLPEILPPLNRSPPQVTILPLTCINSWITLQRIISMLICHLR